jgi:hypothetical protein
MSKQPIISRRLLLAGFWLLGSSAVRAQVKRGDDHGIGGTGITNRGDDHGVGGTGIVGVIQRFGSIFVNGERISYAPGVPVRIDGEPASAKALRIGHVARVVALRQANGTLTTNRIEAVSEVIGPIETVKAGEMSVLGQKVIWSGHESWRRPGVYVAVSGLRRTDGVIVASLVEQRRDAATRVAGPLERSSDGLRIGGLRVVGVDAALVGQRVQAEGHIAQGGMQVARARPDDFSDLSGATRLSIEAYVRRVGASLQLGSGYVARDVSRYQPAAGEARVVVNAILDSSRGLQVESVQSVNKFPGSSVQSPGAPNRAPGSGPGPGGGRPGLPGGAPGAPGAPGGTAPGPANGPGAPSGPGPDSGFGSPGGSSGPGGGPGGGFGPGGLGGSGPGGGGGPAGGGMGGGGRR